MVVGQHGGRSLNFRGQWAVSCSSSPSVFFVGVFAALALGAVNLGTALGVGQVTFGATLVYVLLSEQEQSVSVDERGSRAGVRGG